jgi:probable DNA repair protein
MYDWLTDALDDGTCIVTANRRLSRELQTAWGAIQLAAGETAWRTPDIQAWQGWLGSVAATAEKQGDVPTRINAHQSQLLWERCLRKELGEGATGLPSLVRLSRDTWQRLADARVSIREVARSAKNEDQRLFASAAGRYSAVLENEGWVDDAGLAALALEVIVAKRVTPKKRYVFAGFDRVRPAMTALQSALEEAGSEVLLQEPTRLQTEPVMHEFEHRDAEIRAAGAWARRLLEQQENARIAVIVQGLEQSAGRDLRLLREGFVPGWQYGPASLRDAVNVSYGKRLSEYPSVTVALLSLRWLVQDLPAADVSLLLQSPLLGNGELAGRSRLEQRLRQLPDRAWGPSMVTAALRGKDESQDGSDWLTRIAAFSKRRRELPQYASSAEWVLIIDESLRALGWPGTGTRSSDSYQLINRWRELLNEFARLDLVSSSMSARTAISQLELMAADTVFQPETRQAAVQLLGPLEASGAEFDAIWIGGLTANNWPPAGNPSVLISRALQTKYDMPDATPADTHAWSEKLLRGLLESAPQVVGSYALVEDDVEQTASDFLGEVEITEAPPDPGWHALELLEVSGSCVAVDSIPPVVDEKIYGGASTVQRQLSEPFAAFAFSRLAIRDIDRQALGVTPSLRGNMVHDTLYRLYQDLPSCATLRQISDDDLASHVGVAVDGALQRHLRQADAVLMQLLHLERERIARLVTQFVKLDRDRDDFEVAAVEGEMEFVRGALRLQLRFDRIDRYPDGSIAILDYKTGTAKKLLQRDGTVNEAQLFVYAAAANVPVAALALINIDSRETSFSGAGRGFTDETLWPQLLENIWVQIEAACEKLVAGDVRIVANQGTTSARRLNLLSRYTELRHGD